ncbi:calvin cycle protein CP12-3, chloroplastic [Melia azedarach]|uniref:Calvin cycle protein CP12-3, chloroplastic n=1 Tax=Melia azedarach TaxID=155640 RepID=A0ACC1WTI4_MELAZ|nr:calvin cycle protein CP12-3, chloroplastic [Melia azedarach]
MASLLVLSISSTGTATRSRDSILSLRSSCDAFSSKRVTAVSVYSKAERRNLAVKATGMAKFKGTHMREKKLTEMIEQKVMEARQVCEGDEKSDECKVAWDEVEEVSQAKADLKLKLEKQDPLESFCQDNPETDECRIYED